MYYPVKYKGDNLRVSILIIQNEEIKFNDASKSGNSVKPLSKLRIQVYTLKAPRQGNQILSNKSIKGVSARTPNTKVFSVFRIMAA